MSKAQELTGSVKRQKGRGALSSVSCHLSSDKRGSALLIVLGMFAFMLVSAVAFSVYMRASRAPSSYVLRNTSVRQVAKAAVARAIDEIDTAIGNDPFPGLGYNHDYGNNGINQGNRYKNDSWHGRVFVPSNEVAMADTVSTLTLEGLGYLPPCLVNEVRYWSRHTRTAKWHAFNYGLGRYAFTAVNVSDFFDMGMLSEDSSGGRRQYLNRSSAPHGRVSPAYLFRASRNGDMDTGGSAASAFLNALGGGVGIDPPLSAVPFVSLMDFNLAVGNLGNSLGGMASPFVHLIKNNNNDTFLSGGMEEAARRMLFMAGGWNSYSNLTYQAYSSAYGGSRVDLRYPEFQPFAGYSWFPEQTTLAHCYNDVAESHPFWRPYNANFPVIATALLCDYLDYDSVPLSLCLPCTEAVPMICGVEMNDDCVKYNVTVAEETVQAANPELGTKKKIKRIYSLHVEVNNVEPTLTAVYPFVNGPHAGQQSGYEAEAFVRVFFTEESSLDDGALNDEGLRTSVAEFSLGNNFAWNVGNNAGAAFIEAKCSSANVNVNSSSGVGEAAEQGQVQGDIAIRSAGSISKDAVLATLVYEVDDSGQETLIDSECVNGTDFSFYNRTWGAVNFLDEIKGDLNPDMRFRPSIAVWARIKESGGSGKTVDMVPAIPEYDSLIAHPENAAINKFSLACGGDAGTPLLRFFPQKSDVASGIVLTKEYFKNNTGQSRDAKWKQKAYIANDPRINWAPEQWWATAQTTNPKQLWFERVKNFRQNNSFADTDIFMSVSDQGYLQSMYEWMLIPQVRTLTSSANAEWGDFENGGGYDGRVRLNAENVAHSDLMWRTYRSDAFGYDNNWGSIDGLDFDDAGNGLRVNPYTDNMEIMLGAFANMPRDWWAASTNHLASGKNYMAPGSPTFEDNYLFDWSCNYQDVYNMAYYWSGVFRRRDLSSEERGKHLYTPNGWEKVFEDAVNWRTGTLNYTVPIETETSLAVDTGVLQDGLAGSILQDLTLAERKFLYGYLKGCFANHHQLFIVFVRAETTAGGAVGAGARAVALVWRDPAPPMKVDGQFAKADGGSETPQYGRDNAQQYLRPFSTNGPEDSWRFRTREYPPHRTRILFYHQLD